MKKSLLTFISSAFILNAVAQFQPANASFDDWETLNGPISNTYDEPVSWNTANECTAILNVTPVTKSTDAHSGSHSIRLESLDGPGPTIVMNGVVTTAQMICSANSGGQEGGADFSGVMPDSIVGWYKYAPANQDSAYSQIMFLANNDQDTVSYTRVNFTTTVSSWTRFSAPITQATGTPEKLSLFFSSSWGDGAQGQAEIGSIMYVDAVQFIYPFGTGINTVTNENDWNVYPNPVSGILNIQGSSLEPANFELLDITGKRMMLKRIGAGASSLDLSKLVAGVYLYQISSMDGTSVRTGKLLVNP
ncbi:MAG: T9SS type A sorting domain-containing protein [Flavobacteriales bacterium]|nr:T9SS type A sorting domain-containing protein [Flavobacteriales bacterium]